MQTIMNTNPTPGTYPVSDDEPRLLFVPYWVNAALQRENVGVSALFDKDTLCKIFSKNDIDEIYRLQNNVPLIFKQYLGLHDRQGLSYDTTNAVIESNDAINLIDANLNEVNEPARNVSYSDLMGRTLSFGQYMVFKIIEIPPVDHKTYVGITTYVIEGSPQDKANADSEFVASLIHALRTQGCSIQTLVRTGLIGKYIKRLY